MNIYKTLKNLFTASLSLGLLGFLCQILRRMKKPHSLIASSSSSSSNPQSQNTYDVFLSFSGEIRNTFISYLYAALDKNGIYTFLDVYRLERGLDISPGLDNAIEGSICVVVVLSGKYASSGWCMDELVKILQCRKDVKIKQIVLPIFYHVDPDHILKKKGSIWNAFKSLEKEFRRNVEKVESWRAALIEVATIAGCHIHDGNDLVAKGYMDDEPFKTSECT